MVRLAVTVATSVLLIGISSWGLYGLIGRSRCRRWSSAEASAISPSAISGCSRACRVRCRDGPGASRWSSLGAGSAGVALVHQLQEERGRYRPVAFLDDDRRTHGT
jgi:FlaA1/EpsC-like NDP-sugar epimerase